MARNVCLKLPWRMAIFHVCFEQGRHFSSYFEACCCHFLRHAMHNVCIFIKESNTWRLEQHMHTFEAFENHQEVPESGQNRSQHLDFMINLTGWAILPKMSHAKRNNALSDAELFAGYLGKVLHSIIKNIWCHHAQIQFFFIISTAFPTVKSNCGCRRLCLFTFFVRRNLT